MTTYTCEICSEEKRLGEMTLCGNGHFGGCQKCHMQFVKTQYKTNFEAYSTCTMIQCCMFCREKMPDLQMGDNWSIKLRKLQPIMMYNNAKIRGKVGETTLTELLEWYSSNTESADPADYDMFEDLIDTVKNKKDAVSILCKFVGKFNKGDFNLDTMMTELNSIFSELDDE